MVYFNWSPVDEEVLITRSLLYVGCFLICLICPLHITSDSSNLRHNADLFVWWLREKPRPKVQQMLSLTFATHAPLFVLRRERKEINGNLVEFSPMNSWCFNYVIWWVLGNGCALIMSLGQLKDRAKHYWQICAEGIPVTEYCVALERWAAPIVKPYSAQQIETTFVDLLSSHGECVYGWAKARHRHTFTSKCLNLWRRRRVFFFLFLAAAGWIWCRFHS